MATPDLSRLNVLIADDSRMMRELLVAMLAALGIRNIRAVRDGAEALNALKTQNFDILITDADMGALGGLDLVKIVRRTGSAPDPYIPIIMITGRCEREWVEAARDAGVNEFVAKPVSGDSLYRRLVEVILNPRPFVRTEDFVGPDRRRRPSPNHEQKRRRSDVRTIGEEDGMIEYAERTANE
jgi:two-component system, chemotaxis family, chemotaxis protein CheY